MIDHEYDVLIIGSGPAGVSAAFPLIEKGLKVAMVDGSSSTPSYPQGQLINRINESFGDDYAELRPQDNKSPKQRLNKNHSLTNLFLKKTGLLAKNFSVAGAINRGGLSTVWGGYITEYDNIDLKDFPFKYQDIKHSYQVIAQRIGISGNHDDVLDSFHGSDTPLQPPPSIHPSAAILLSRSKSISTQNLSIGIARNALITEPLAGRDSCNFCKGCLWTCPNKSIYSSLYDLNALEKFNNFYLINNFYVDKIISEPNRLIAASSTQEIRAKKILLAAGTLESTRILMLSLGLQNKSIKLLSNPLILLPIWIPAAINVAYPKHGYTLAQLSLRFNLRSNYAFGCMYTLDGLPLDFVTTKLPFSLKGGALLSAWLSKTTLLTSVYLGGEFSSNTVTMNNQRLLIDSHTSKDLALEREFIKLNISREFRKLGAYVLPGTQYAENGLDSHYAGTCPMGGDGDLSSDFVGEVKNFKGLHVVDGSALPALPAKHLTFTIMANADRIARHICTRISTLK